MKYELFEVDQSTLDEKIWKLVPQKRKELLEKIKQNSNREFKEIYDDIYEGFITGANPIYIVDQTSIEKFGLEEKILQRVPKGRDVRRWLIKWNNRYVVYPHKENGESLTEQELRGECPNVYEYLKQHKDALKKRKYYRKTPEELHGTWFALVHPKPKTLFSSEKIIVPNLSTHNNFAYDQDGTYYVDHDCYGIILREKKRDHHLYILALLNSKLLEFFIKHISPYASGKYFRYMTGYLEQLPLLVPCSDKEKSTARDIIKKTDSLLQLNNQLSELEEKIENFPEYCTSEKLEKITKVAEDYRNLKKDKYRVRSPKIEKSGKNLYKLSLEKDNYITLASRELAEYVLEWLKRRKRVRRRELLGLEVPSGKEAAKIMGELSGNRERVEELKGEVKGLEGEIDGLVYELYGLDAKDRKVIEEFLEKF